MWTHEESIETTATIAKIWELFSDVKGWKKWNLGIEEIEIHGPFAVGTTFNMQLPRDEALITSTLVKVEENEAFTDETVFNDTRISVHHIMTLLPFGNVKVTYAAEVRGSNEAEIGTMVTSDFPVVLKTLKTLAENSR